MISHSKPWLIDADRQAVDRVLLSGMLTQGNLTDEFEASAALYLGSAGSVATGSGTSALMLALKSLRVEARAEVILPTYVCRSVIEAVVGVGATPVLCDVGDYWNMTPESVASKVTSRTAAIIVVHLYGIPANTHAFKQFGVPIIEDCCQALGAQVEGQKVGTIGALGVFSFHATKCMTTAEGGLAVSNDTELLTRVRAMRDGIDGELANPFVSRMTDLQAALGLSQLSRYADFLKRRQEIADLYFSELRECSIQMPGAVREKSIFVRFPVKIKGDFDSCRRRFDVLGVQVRHGVDDLLHWGRALNGDAFPAAERLFAETISIPIYPALEESEIDAVVQACNAIWRS